MPSVGSRRPSSGRPSEGVRCRGLPVPDLSVRSRFDHESATEESTTGAPLASNHGSTNSCPSVSHLRSGDESLPEAGVRGRNARHCPHWISGRLIGQCGQPPSQGRGRRSRSTVEAVTGVAFDPNFERGAMVAGGRRGGRRGAAQDPSGADIPSVAYLFKTRVGSSPSTPSTATCRARRRPPI